MRRGLQLAVALAVVPLTAAAVDVTWAASARTELRVRYDKAKIGRNVSHFEFNIGRVAAAKAKPVLPPAPAPAPVVDKAAERLEWEAHMRRLGYDPAELMAKAGGPPRGDGV